MNHILQLITRSSSSLLSRSGLKHAFIAGHFLTPVSVLPTPIPQGCKFAASLAEARQHVSLLEGRWKKSATTFSNFLLLLLLLLKQCLILLGPVGSPIKIHYTMTLCKMDHSLLCFIAFGHCTYKSRCG